MHRRSAPPASLFGNSYGVGRRPSRLTLGAAVATVAAAAAVAAGIAAGPGSSAGLAGNAAAISRTGDHQPAAHAAVPGRSVTHHRRPGRHHSTPAAHRAAPIAGRAEHPRHHAAPAGKPYLIYDSVNPMAIPGRHAVATYATGGYAVSAWEVAGRRTVLWIDTRGTDPAASVLDVEPGDATPSIAASWAWQRLHDYPHAVARIYTMRAEWPATEAAVSQLPATMRSRIRWWIADPTGYPHLVPGSDATQWYWGKAYDISTASPRF